MCDAENPEKRYQKNLITFYLVAIKWKNLVNKREKTVEGENISCILLENNQIYFLDFLKTFAKGNKFLFISGIGQKTGDNNDEYSNF